MTPSPSLSDAPSAVTGGPCALRVLLLPGWQNSDDAHWQSRWEQLHAYRRVEQDDWMWPRRGDWMARLDEVLLEDERPAVLVAHSLGCQLAASWAAHSRHAARVRAALLVAPPDTAREGTPPQLHNWQRLDLGRLPFAARVLASRDDPYCDFARAGAFAEAWGAELVDVGARGHINTASGLGDWPEGHEGLLDLLRRSGLRS